MERVDLVTRKKILLVDDAATILLVEQMILRKLPYDLLTARNGLEALSIAEESQPDLILMDVNMPKMTGFEALRRLRQTEGTRDIPVIIVTTRSEMENVQIAYESGCTDYITKPISQVELVEKVQNYLGDTE
jgi:CheY-like chemotaxis protein